MGGALMVVSVGLYVFGVAPKTFAVAFLAGSVLFAVMQIMQRYDGTSVTIRRLRTILTIADIAFIVAGLLMVENSWHFIYQPLVYGDGDVPNIEMHIRYLRYINNNWVVALLIATLLELYAINRISSEVRKLERKAEGGNGNAEKNIKE